MEKGEIILYQPNETIKLEVRLEEESVWLTRHQLALLFNRDIKTIGKHINNALREELDGIPVVAKFATTATDGKRYNTEHYNLDMILSVGYRVKSSRGIEFRRWANQVLKDYLLKGYSINHRLQALERTVAEHSKYFNKTSIIWNSYKSFKASSKKKSQTVSTRLHVSTDGGRNSHAIGVNQSVVG